MRPLETEPAGGRWRQALPTQEGTGLRARVILLVRVGGLCAEDTEWPSWAREGFVGSTLGAHRIDGNNADLGAGLLGRLTGDLPQSARRFSLFSCPLLQI